MKAWPESESELARVVVQWLQDLRWEVFQEVQVCAHGRVGDIVARQGRLIWVIECKRTLGLEVMGQADGWRGHAHYVSVAAPESRRGGLALRVCEWLGVGVLEVTSCDMVREASRPRLNRRALIGWWRILSEDHKTFAKAGNAEGRHWTPFQGTCLAVAGFLGAHGGRAKLKDVIAQVPTHYGSTATARACLLKWAEMGSIKGVECAREGREVWLRLIPMKSGEVKGNE